MKCWDRKIDSDEGERKRGANVNGSAHTMKRIIPKERLAFVQLWKEGQNHLEYYSRYQMVGHFLKQRKKRFVGSLYLVIEGPIQVKSARGSSPKM